MIVVDASAVPDRPSGVRTRLRGLYGAYAALAEAPRVCLRVARGSRLFDGLGFSASERVFVEECEAPGGPFARAWRLRGPAVRDCRLWHAETLPGRGPAGVPTLLTLHDLRWFEPRSAVGGSFGGHLARASAARLFESRWANRAARVVTVSTASALEIERRLHVPRERIAVIANATHEVEPEEESAESADSERGPLSTLARTAAPYFLAVGHLERRKRIDLALDALAECRQPVSLVLAGEGPERASLERRAKGRGVAERVHFLGRVADSARRLLLRHAAALLLPSRIEGFAFSVYEALGQGCPVLAAPLDCLAELPEPAVRRLAAEPAVWARAFEAAVTVQDRVALAPNVASLAEHLRAGTWKARARSLADLYRRVLEEHAAR